MEFGFVFFFNSILLGIGLSMDAFSISLANGLSEPAMHRRKMCLIAGTFAFFQALMPMAGWVCVHTIVEHFRAFERLIPWVALILLGYIGGKMLIEGIRNRNGSAEAPSGIGLTVLLVQGVATSVDALSVGFTIADYDLTMALTAALIIAAVTFAICLAGLKIGKTAGTHLAGRAGIVGGSILLFIAIEIFVSSWLL